MSMRRREFQKKGGSGASGSKTRKPSGGLGSDQTRVAKIAEAGRKVGDHLGKKVGPGKLFQGDPQMSKPAKEENMKEIKKFTEKKHKG